MSVRRNTPYAVDCKTQIFAKFALSSTPFGGRTLYNWNVRNYEAALTQNVLARSEEGKPQ